MGKDLVQDYITEDYQKSVGAVLTQALSGIERSNFEFPLITKDDIRIEVLLNATPRYDFLGNVIGGWNNHHRIEAWVFNVLLVVGIGQDITEMLQTEQEYSRIIEKANAPIFGVDKDGAINIWLV